MKREEARRAIFADLVKSNDDDPRTLPTAEIVKTPDTTDYNDVDERAKRRGEVVLKVDSRFSTIWYRILAHLAADEVSRKRFRGKNPDWSRVSASEGAVEDWEEYCADLLWQNADPVYYRRVKNDGGCFCLF